MPLTVSELRILLNLFVMNFTLCPVLLFGARLLCEKYSPFQGAAIIPWDFMDLSTAKCLLSSC